MSTTGRVGPAAAIARRAPAGLGSRLAPWLAVPAVWLAVTWVAGARQGLLLLVGLGFGARANRC
jgi:hypothetical protein